MTSALAARNSSPSPPFYSFPPPLCLSVLLLTLRRRARCFRPAFPAPLLSALAAAPWLGNACCVVMFLHKKCCAMRVERCGLLVACCDHFAFLFKNKRTEIGSAAATCRCKRMQGNNREWRQMRNEKPCESTFCGGSGVLLRLFHPTPLPFPTFPYSPSTPSLHLLS